MNQTKKAVIFGTGDFAEVMNFYLTHDSPYEVLAHTVTKDCLQVENYLDLPLVPFEHLEDLYPPQEVELYIAIGYAQMNRVRQRFYKKAKEKGYRLLSYVSSKATVWTPFIGEHCCILEDNTVQPFVKIGDNTVLWSGNHIGHHSVIGSHVFISSHVVISGRCHVNDHVFLGVNATLRDGITIAKDSLVGAGALMMKSSEEGKVYAQRGTALFPKESCELMG